LTASADLIQGRAKYILYALLSACRLSAHSAKLRKPTVASGYAGIVTGATSISRADRRCRTGIPLSPAVQSWS
jgi:hypothetical protein